MLLSIKTESILQSFFFEKTVSFYPFIIALVVLLLAFLWYNQVKNIRRSKKKQAGKGMVGLINPILILGIVTLLVLMLLALPFFFEKLEEAINEKESDEVSFNPKNIYDKTFHVDGMESLDCEALLKSVLTAHKDIILVETSHNKNTATVLFDTTMINNSQVIEIIEAAGFNLKNSH